MSYETKAFDTVNRDLLWNILTALPLLLTYYNSIPVSVIKLSWLVLSAPAFLLKWE